MPSLFGDANIQTCVVGKGLGRSENGISEAIKVKIKCGKAGVSNVTVENIFLFLDNCIEYSIWAVNNMEIKLYHVVCIIIIHELEMLLKTIQVKCSISLYRSLVFTYLAFGMLRYQLLQPLCTLCLYLRCTVCIQMGHNEGEQFSFHWWDHVFNKASSGLVVESGQVSNMKRI